MIYEGKHIGAYIQVYAWLLLKIRNLAILNIFLHIIKIIRPNSGNFLVSSFVSHMHDIVLKAENTININKCHTCQKGSTFIKCLFELQQNPLHTGPSSLRLDS